MEKKKAMISQPMAGRTDADLIDRPECGAEEV